MQSLSNTMSVWRRVRSPVVSAAVMCACALAVAPALAQPSYQGFLCCNLRADSGGWISDSNYHDASKRVIAFGTRTKVVGFGRSRVELEVNGQKLYLGNDYSRDIELAAFAQRYVIKGNPRNKFNEYPPQIQTAIRKMRIAKGMNRDQVLMSVGYPTSGQNPTLRAPEWKYWLNRSAPYTVIWNGQGLVGDVKADPQTRLLVLQR